MNRFLVSTVAVALLFSGVTSIVAADDWCSDDPPVRIQTPSGHSVVVKVTDYALGLQHADALKLVTYGYVATPDQDGVSTDVTLTVMIPGDALDASFPTKSVVSTAADENSKVYQVFASAGSAAGTAIVHQFKLGVR